MAHVRAQGRAHEVGGLTRAERRAKKDRKARREATQRELRETQGTLLDVTFGRPNVVKLDDRRKA